MHVVNSVSCCQLLYDVSISLLWPILPLMASIVTTAVTQVWHYSSNMVRPLSWKRSLMAQKETVPLIRLNGFNRNFSSNYGRVFIAATSQADML